MDRRNLRSFSLSVYGTLGDEALRHVDDLHVGFGHCAGTSRSTTIPCPHFVQNSFRMAIGLGVP